MKILLVDDHTLVRNGLVQLIKICVEGAEVTEAGSAEEAVQILAKEPHDVALVDIRLPGQSGLELLQEVRRAWPKLPVIMLTNYDHPEYVKSAMAAGAAGYLLKDSTPADLSQAITVAMTGAGNVMSARAISNLFDENRPQEIAGHDERAPARQRGSTDPARDGDPGAAGGRATATGRSRSACSCRRRRSRPTWPRSSGSWGSTTGRRRR